MFSNLHMHNIYVIFSVSDTSQTTTILEYHIILTIYASSDPGTKNTLFKENCQSFLEKSKCLFTEINSFNKLSKYLFIYM